MYMIVLYMDKEGNSYITCSNLTCRVDRCDDIFVYGVRVSSVVEYSDKGDSCAMVL